MSRSLFSILFFLGLAPLLAAQENTFESAATGAGGDLRAAINELRETREAIAGERIPLVRRQRELEAEASQLRREFQRQQRLIDSGQLELEALRSEVQRRQDQHFYQKGLLAEYLRDLEAGLPISELEMFAPLLRAARIESDNSGKSSVAAELEAVRLSLARLREQIGGRHYDGEAVGPEGEIEPGKFLEIGPVLLFSNENFASFVGERVGSLKAHLLASGRDHPRQLREVVETGRGILPFDPTLGQAMRLADAQVSFSERIRAGGVVMIPILALALAALVVAIIKWMQIAGIQTAPPEALQEILTFLERGEKSNALDRAKKIRGPVGQLLHTAVANVDERRELLEEILYERILQTQPRLERYLPFLALTAAAAPLLGLLGTVTGMINTFQLITLFGTGDARTLSGGISEALITTQFGLGVAIVALLVHALLSRKAKGVVANMEQTEAAFLNGLSTASQSGHD